MFIIGEMDHSYVITWSLFKVKWIEVRKLMRGRLTTNPIIFEPYRDLPQFFGGLKY